MKGLQLPHATQVAVATRRRTPRFKVSQFDREGNWVRDIPEHSPLHAEAVEDFKRLRCPRRLVIEGICYGVQEDN